MTSAIQTQLNGKAASSHGTHVTYSTTAPSANGTASAGNAATVARSDHVHPLQTTVSGNAGTATRLANTHTIWGLDFNGTQNITGDPIIANNDPYIYLKHTSLTKGKGSASNEYAGVYITDSTTTESSKIGETLAAMFFQQQDKSASRNLYFRVYSPLAGSTKNVYLRLLYSGTTDTTTTSSTYLNTLTENAAGTLSTNAATFTINSASGVAKTQAYNTITIGNSTGAFNAGNAAGRIQLYGISDTAADSTAFTATIQPEILTAARTFKLPNANGHLAVGATAGVGSTTQPVYLAASGVLTACKEMLPLTGGTLTGNITINHTCAKGYAAIPDSNGKPDEGSLSEKALAFHSSDGKKMGSIIHRCHKTGNTSFNFITYYNSESSSSRKMARVTLKYPKNTSETPYFVGVVDDEINENFAEAKINLGTAGTRWSDVFSESASLNSVSDEREKDDIEAIPDLVLDAWENVTPIQFKFKNAKVIKGDGARYHTGYTAQRIKAKFDAKGVDPELYGLYLYDKWDAQEEERDEDGNLIEAARPAGDSYGLRYVECLVVEAAYQRRRADRMEQRVNQLESELADIKAKLASIESRLS